MTQTQLIEKLATLPTWSDADRRRLYADFAEYVPLVAMLVPQNERKTLAIELPKKWDRKRPADPEVLKLVRTETWLMIQSFRDLHLVALFVLLMEERGRHQDAGSAVTKVAPQAPAAVPAELDDDLPF